MHTWQAYSAGLLSTVYCRLLLAWRTRIMRISPDSMSYDHARCLSRWMYQSVVSEYGDFKSPSMPPRIRYQRLRKTQRLRQPLHHTYHMLKKRRILQNFTKLFAHIQYFSLSLHDITHERPKKQTRIRYNNFINNQFY